MKGTIARSRPYAARRPGQICRYAGSLFLPLLLLALAPLPTLAQQDGFSSSVVDSSPSSASGAPGGGSARDTSADPGTAVANPVRELTRPREFGVLVQAGTGLTQERSSFKFLMAGVHAGKVLTPNLLSGLLRGNAEYAVEIFPLWQSYTPRFQRVRCDPQPGTVLISCTPPYTVGGTFTGVTATPIILRWNFAGSGRVSPWVQGAGGVLWTNHKYPAFGDTKVLNLQNDGPNADASVWNFTPQGGIGLHYFVDSRHSLDLAANAVHISSASLGDRNPGVNASVQFSLGYSWWK